MTVRETIGPAEFATPGEVRFCAGCGDHGVLKALRMTLAETGADPVDTVVISGIGCAARMVYYLDTYGFHTIHGRAAAVATGVKLANPALDVWVMGGDGDMIAIGGNHFVHLMRRDVDCQLLLVNNEIYGLTKGQASPTTSPGTATSTTPGGAVDMPVNAARLALAAGAGFVARSGDIMTAHLVQTLTRARAHRGTAMVEVMQNCRIFNDAAHADFMEKRVRDDAQIVLRHGAPLRFGQNGTKGLRLRPGTISLEVVQVGENGVSEDDILRHDETDLTLAFLLAAMEPPDMPVAMGVLHARPVQAAAASYMEAPTFDLAAEMRSGPLLPAGPVLANG